MITAIKTKLENAITNIPKLDIKVEEFSLIKALIYKKMEDVDGIIDIRYDSLNKNYCGNLIAKEFCGYNNDNIVIICEYYHDIFDEHCIRIFDIFDHNGKNLEIKLMESI